MDQNDQKQEFIINANYEIFVLLVTLLSIVNNVVWLFPLEPLTRNVIQIIEYGISIFLILDFLFRLLRARYKKEYFFHFFGWLDLVGSLPVFGLRLARLARPLILGRKIRKDEFSMMGGVIVRQRAQSTLLAAIFVALLVFEISGITILRAESHSPEANIQTAGDALWWAYVTVATVGYGDRYPVTPDGRVVGVFVITVGVGLFSVLTGFLADFFRRPRISRPKGLLRSGSPVKNDTSAMLDEIQRLLEEHQAHHQQTMDELRLRLEEIKKSLDQ
jgi:voltage-gated potassium channel Kch